jgi:hypothetical protein
MPILQSMNCVNSLDKPELQRDEEEEKREQGVRSPEAVKLKAKWKMWNSE